MTTASSSDADIKDVVYVPDPERIAAQNDRFRRGVCSNPPALPVPGPDALRGRVVFSHAVAARGLLFTLQCLAAIAAHDTFEVENDPHGEHDFGAVTVEGERVWFKIDAYADDSMQFGSERPDVPLETYRVMTVLFPSDW